LVTANNNKQSSNFKRYQLYRGLYSRVARKLGVDRSYVSRVARGERKSPEIEAALQAELRRIEKL
jgi:transcriptional regulator with XRE-family HTH domain